MNEARVMYGLNGMVPPLGLIEGENEGETLEAPTGVVELPLYPDKDWTVADIDDWAKKNGLTFDGNPSKDKKLEAVAEFLGLSPDKN